LIIDESKQYGLEIYGVSQRCKFLSARGLSWQHREKRKGPESDNVLVSFSMAIEKDYPVLL
jgi:hypothetical protein